MKTADEMFEELGYKMSETYSEHRTIQKHYEIKEVF